MSIYGPDVLSVTQLTVLKHWNT